MNELIALRLQLLNTQAQLKLTQAELLRHEHAELIRQMQQLSAAQRADDLPTIDGDEA